MHREIKAIKSGNLSTEDFIHEFDKSSLKLVMYVTSRKFLATHKKHCRRTLFDSTIDLVGILEL